MTSALLQNYVPLVILGWPCLYAGGSSCCGCLWRHGLRRNWPQYATLGALAGILGATALGLIASLFGGTDRLISAPCAPAAAVLSAFAIELARQNVVPASIIVLLIVLGVLTGLLQILLGFLGIGRMIKYIPYPVVSGYLSGVGLIIIFSQVKNFMGATTTSSWWQVVVDPGLWDMRSIRVGTATVLVALLGPKITKAIPGTILGILPACSPILAWR